MSKRPYLYKRQITEAVYIPPLNLHKNEAARVTTLDYRVADLQGKSQKNQEMNIKQKKTDTMKDKTLESVPNSKSQSKQSLDKLKSSLTFFPQHVKARKQIVSKGKRVQTQASNPEQKSHEGALFPREESKEKYFKRKTKLNVSISTAHLFSKERNNRSSSSLINEDDTLNFLNQSNLDLEDLNQQRKILLQQNQLLKNQLKLKSNLEKQNLKINNLLKQKDKELVLINSSIENLNKLLKQKQNTISYLSTENTNLKSKCEELQKDLKKTNLKELTNNSKTLKHQGKSLLNLQQMVFEDRNIFQTNDKLIATLMGELKYCKIEIDMLKKIKLEKIEILEELDNAKSKNHELAARLKLCYNQSQSQIKLTDISKSFLSESDSLSLNLSNEDDEESQKRMKQKNGSKLKENYMQKIKENVMQRDIKASKRYLSSGGKHIQ